MKIGKRITSLFLVFLFLFSMTAGVLAQTQEELQNEIDASGERQEEIQVQIDTSKDTISEIETEVVKADNEISKLTSRIAELSAQIEEYKANIEKAQAELEVAQQKEAEQEEALMARIRTMYMYGNDGYLQVMFSAENLSDMVTRIDMVQSIMKADRAYADELEATRVDIENKKNQIIADQQAAEKAKAEEQLSLVEEQTLRTQKQELIDKNQALIAEYRAALDSEVAATDELKRQIAELAGTYGGAVSPISGWIWPLPGNYDVTSVYGWRIHPIFGEGRGHDGIDIGASYGTPILAVGNGQVIKEAYSEKDGYGNHIVLDMGNGYQTLYAHMSRISVSKGQTVSQGDVIGYVGSTGWSTGPHLHIGVYTGSTSHDPLDYLPY